MKAHGYGDVCTDIDPAACRGAALFVEADIRNLPFANKQFGVSFNSHVLEHMPTLEDCREAWQELHRVADVVITCVPSKQSLIAWLVPDHYLWVHEMSDGALAVEERRGSRRKALLPPSG